MSLEKRHFDVVGVHIDGQREASMTILPAPNPSTGGWVVEVRAKGHRRVYRLGISEVAEMVAWRSAKKEATR